MSGVAFVGARMFRRFTLQVGFGGDVGHVTLLAWW